MRALKIPARQQGRGRTGAGAHGHHGGPSSVQQGGRAQLGALGRALRQAGWSDDTPVSVVSRAGWPDQLASDHTLASLAQAAMLHAGRPTVVVVGAGAQAVAMAPYTAPVEVAEAGIAGAAT